MVLKGQQQLLVVALHVLHIRERVGCEFVGFQWGLGRKGAGRGWTSSWLQACTTPPTPPPAPPLHPNQSTHPGHALRLRGLDALLPCGRHLLPLASRRHGVEAAPGSHLLEDGVGLPGAAVELRGPAGQGGAGTCLKRQGQDGRMPGSSAVPAGQKACFTSCTSSHREPPDQAHLGPGRQVLVARLLEVVERHLKRLPRGRHATMGKGRPAGGSAHAAGMKQGVKIRQA